MITPAAVGACMTGGSVPSPIMRKHAGSNGDGGKHTLYIFNFMAIVVGSDGKEAFQNREAENIVGLQPKYRWRRHLSSIFCPGILFLHDNRSHASY